MDTLNNLILNFTEVVEDFRDTILDFDSDLSRVESRVSSLESILGFVVVLQIISIAMICFFIKRNNDKNDK